jgi:hypothetical protein
VVLPGGGERVPLTLPSSLPNIGTLMLSFWQTSWKRVVKTVFAPSVMRFKSFDRAMAPPANNHLREIDPFFPQPPMVRHKGQRTKKILLWFLTTLLRTSRDVAQNPVLAYAVAILVFERAVDGGDGWGIAGFLFVSLSDDRRQNRYFYPFRGA